MVIRGNTRGNGSQLGQYLLTMKDNDHIQILEVAGRHYASEGYLHDVIFGMQLNSELTKSVKGLYHAQINPSENESKTMTPEDWVKAADILEKELGFDNQTRILVLHEKKGRIHAHVVWDRYDVSLGKMKQVDFSRLAQDRARKTMETTFNHQATPTRNKHRPEMKASLTDLWGKTKTGFEFINEAEKSGYLIAQGSMRNPFMVVDEQGRSFDLLRQLIGIRTKEVRERMRHETLKTEKRAIEIIRAKQNSGSGKSEQQVASSTSKERAKETANQFAQNRNETVFESNQDKQKRKQQRAKEVFEQSAKQVTDAKEKEQGSYKETLANEFAQSRNDSTAKLETKEDVNPQKEKEQKIREEFSENKEEQVKESERERRYRELMEQMRELREQNRGQDFEI